MSIGLRFCQCVLVAGRVTAIVIFVATVCCAPTKGISGLIVNLDSSNLTATPGSTVTAQGSVGNQTGTSLASTDLFLNFANFDPNVFVSFVQLLGTSDFTILNGSQSARVDLFRFTIDPSAGAGTYSFDVVLQDANNNFTEAIKVNVNLPQTPPPTPTPTPTSVNGRGTLNGSGDQASFSLTATKGKKKRWKGTFSYNDPAAGLMISTKKLRHFALVGNHVHFTGSAKIAKKKITFTIDATDNRVPGTIDTFSITASNGYSASGNLTSGDIMIH